jgi:transcription termination factor Rho
LTKQEYEGMTLTALKDIAKDLGVKNISKYKKNELIEEIIKNLPNSIEKNGVILRENIAPKASEQPKTEKTAVDNSTATDNRETVRTNNETRTNTKLEGNKTLTEAQIAEKKENLKEMINDSTMAKGILEILKITALVF